MVKQIVREIADNFQTQLGLYQKMAELSSAQLNCLEKNQDMSGELRDIMSRRQALMEDISSLNEKNRACQQQAVQQLGINEFVLSKLLGQIDEGDYEQLRDIVSRLGLILEAINEMDRKNQLLMVEINTGKAGGERKSSSRQASDAYRRSMNLDKIDPGR